ncbi:hypothetical protein ABE438_17515 [Bosea sp. TWI1241]
MSAAFAVLLLLIMAVVNAPRQTGRLIAKVVIGFRAQLRDEGEA